MSETAVKTDHTNGQADSKRTRRTRSFPSNDLQATLAIAKSISENNAEKPFSRLSLAESLQRSPDSSSFRSLITSSAAYGLTLGSYKAPTIALTEVGLSVVASRSEQERSQALVTAVKNIDLFERLLQHFDQNRIPQRELFKNTLVRDYAVDPDLALECVDHFLSDGKFTGLIRTIAGTDRVDLNQPLTSLNSTDAQETVGDGPKDAGGTNGHKDTGAYEEHPPGFAVATPAHISESTRVESNRVFISHGRNKAVVEQLKELLTFGKFTPVVAVDQETTALPVPEKVFEAMRSCVAGVIHVEDEVELMDMDGKPQRRINDNVLIEIGAAIALYQRKFFLLVKKGVTLPSNLQGLYRCDYEGDKLDLEAAMKLLKTFNQFNGSRSS